MNQEIRTFNIWMKIKASLLDIKETQIKKKKNSGTSDNSKWWWYQRNRHSHIIGKYKLISLLKVNMIVYQAYKPINWPQQFYSRKSNLGEIMNKCTQKFCDASMIIGKKTKN